MARSKQKRLEELERRLRWKARRPAPTAASIPRNPHRSEPTGDTITLDGDELANHGLPKLSERILEMIAPFRKPERSAKSLRNLINICTLAWNLSQFDDATRDRELHQAEVRLFPQIKEFITRVIQQRGAVTTDELGEVLCSETCQELIIFHSLVLTFIKRRLEHYPQDNRIIVDCRVDESGAEPKLLITSAASPEMVPAGFATT